RCFRPPAAGRRFPTESVFEFCAADWPALPIPCASHTGSPVRRRPRRGHGRATPAGLSRGRNCALCPVLCRPRAGTAAFDRDLPYKSSCYAFVPRVPDNGNLGREKPRISRSPWLTLRVRFAHKRARPGRRHRLPVSTSSRPFSSPFQAGRPMLLNGGVSRVAKGADCKSAASWLRRFESFLLHHPASPNGLRRIESRPLAKQDALRSLGEGGLLHCITSIFLKAKCLSTSATSAWHPILSADYQTIIPASLRTPPNSRRG